MPNPRDVLAKAFTRLHRALFDATKGRLGGTGFGMPVVKLETTGRKSGAQRATMLTMPIHDDNRVVLVASNGGADRHPAWYLNLTAKPEVRVTFDGRTREMVAHTASFEEKAELWPEVTAAYKGYAGYQTKTDRDIPLVVLSPAPE